VKVVVRICQPARPPDRACYAVLNVLASYSTTHVHSPLNCTPHSVTTRPTQAIYTIDSPMEPFEDENPFSTADPPLSSASSNSHVDVSAPSSPANNTVTLPSHPPRVGIQTSSLRSGFPSQGSGHNTRSPTSKSDFCCVRDQWLHSGEDVEILVSRFLPFESLHFAFCG
jgi:hypothetical protein